MPAIITHDTFGRDLYNDHFRFIGQSKQEADAFLLGNQGPDPLFYLFSTPRYVSAIRLGSIMHHRDTKTLLQALKASIYTLPESQRSIGRAYALGFLAHYQLDSRMHPLIYSQQNDITDAGVPDLEKRHGRSVHAVIESELDEMVLFTRRGETIASFKPAERILCADDETLDIISRMYVYMAKEVYGMSIPAETYKFAVIGFRNVLRIMHSPLGIKRQAIGHLETLVRRYSIFKAMSHRNIELTESVFENRARNPWTNPFTGATSTESFDDIFESAKRDAAANMLLFDREGFGEVEARAITDDMDFSGDLVEARILTIEDISDGADD